MFTRNWYRLIAMKITGVTHPDGFRNYAGGNWQYTSAGNLGICIGGSNSFFEPHMSNLVKEIGYSGVIIGTGTAPAAFDDYKLSGDLITKFSFSVSVNKKHTESGFEVTALYTITNTNSTEITIGEIGLIANQYTNSTSASYVALLERTVLEEPVTIPPGGIGQVEYTIRMNYPVEAAE